MLYNQNNSSETTETTQESPNPEIPERYQTAAFAAGCFWGVEYTYQHVPGVINTRVGFMGGHVDNPTYKQVCYTDTNHAEVVQLAYDPEKISYEQLVRIFFLIHDPTTLNRQGPDVGTQYRSAIFYQDQAQKETAEKVKAEFDQSGRFKNPIVTEITLAGPFWKAEDYHQSYFQKNPGRCHIVNIPQVLHEVGIN